MNDEEKIEYLKRSYSAVDGLWFMMAEEAFGFDKALELDKKVWQVMPKIQARFLKQYIDTTDSMEALRITFSEKLKMDGCDFEAKKTPKGFDIRISKCPWHENMLRSGREHLSSTIGDTICAAEYSGWAKEFSDDIRLEFQERICCGEKDCLLRFSRK